MQTQSAQEAWSIVEDSSIKNLVNFKEQSCDIQSSTKLDSAKLHILEETPIKGKSKHSVLSHEISKIRGFVTTSPSHMSLDNSLDSSENSLSLEDKKIDFNNVDLKFLTEDISQFNYTTQNATTVGESSCSFKRIDSGFNENTFYANASSYYESAIKPSELTVTETSKNINNSALKEISNVTWMRVDSGFKDETSTDSTQFFTSDSSNSKFTGFRFTEAKIQDKENVDSFVHAINKNALSMSDIFTEDMKLNCNSSSTPSKNKSRKVNS